MSEESKLVRGRLENILDKGDKLPLDKLLIILSVLQEQVVESLKDIVKEASKQKWYLDRLISLVIEEIPWLLDEVDSSIDNIPLTSNTEEFC